MHRLPREGVRQRSSVSEQRGDVFDPVDFHTTLSTISGRAFSPYPFFLASLRGGTSKGPSEITDPGGEGLGFSEADASFLLKGLYGKVLASAVAVREQQEAN